MNSETGRVIREMGLSPEEREQRREAFNRIAAEDLALVERLTMDYMAMQSGNPLTGERIRQSVFRIVDIFGWYGTTLPRGYKVLGNGQKTPYYLQLTDGSRPSDAQLVADAMSGWLTEIAERMGNQIANKRRETATPGK